MPILFLGAKGTDVCAGVDPVAFDHRRGTVRRQRQEIGDLADFLRGDGADGRQPRAA